MKCLAVNTANSLLSVALVDGDAVLYRFNTPETRDQGNLILSHAKQALDKAGIDFDGLNLLAVVTGPGSFTGIRIGLAAMRGLALATGLPLVGITSFELFAAPAKNNIIAIESWREELYLQLDGQPPVNRTPDDFLKTAGAGPFTISGDAKEKISVTGATLHTAEPDAVDAARIAIEKLRKNGAGEKPVPFYLRDADVTISNKNRKVEQA